MNFNNLVNSILLLNELNEKEVVKASKAKESSKITSYGPIFEKERTVIDISEVSNDYLLNEYSTLLGRYKKSQTHENRIDLMSFLDRLIILIKTEFNKTAYIIIDDEFNYTFEKFAIQIQTQQGIKEREISYGTFLSKLKTSKVFAVITHNPIDIAGLSVDKRWTSCNDRGNIHSDKPYKEITNGGMVAYLIQGKPEEMNEIMDDHKVHGKMYYQAIGRIAIRRYESPNKKNQEKGFIFDIEPTIYSTVGSQGIIEQVGFKEKVKKTLENSNKATSLSPINIFSRRGYTDSAEKSLVYKNIAAMASSYNKETDSYDFDNGYKITDADLDSNYKIKFNFGSFHGDLIIATSFWNYLPRTTASFCNSLPKLIDGNLMFDSGYKVKIIFLNQYNYCKTRELNKKERSEYFKNYLKKAYNIEITGKVIFDYL